MKWAEQHQALVGIIALIVSATAYSFTVFATKEYVEQKHQDVKEILTEIKQDSKETKAMVFELYKRGK